MKQIAVIFKALMVTVLVSALAGCGGNFFDSGHADSGLLDGQGKPAVRQSDFYGEWLWRDAGAPRLRSFAISETSIRDFNYSPGNASGTAAYQPKRWLRLTNTDTQFEVSRSYPEGFVITTVLENYSGNDTHERVIHELYLHFDKQSLIRYLDGGYYIYKKAELRDTEDGVPKRITITGIPMEDFTGSPFARLEIISFFTGQSVASATVNNLGNDITFSLGGWTGTGAYRLWFEIHAEYYQGRPLWWTPFVKDFVLISGEETVIPFTREAWDNWPLDNL